MKAIILAAGMGNRLEKYTKDKPKCMLEFRGETLLQRQIDTLKSCGIKKIVVVKGYLPEKINISGVKYYVNEEYKSTNMVETLMKAEEEMDEDIIVCYGDILYEKRLIEKMMESAADIGVVVDDDYFDYWNIRFGSIDKEVESLVINQNGNIIEIGEENSSLEKAKVRYVGLIKFSKEGIKTLKKTYRENKEEYHGKEVPWMNSKSFKKAYMTCMLQAIINDGKEVKPIMISRGWVEFDTDEDYEKITLLDKERELGNIISI